MEALRFSEFCANCRASLSELDRVLFVEKEIGRCFCSEDCIREYFQPTVEQMEGELGKLRSAQDFSEIERKKLDHYRILTLQDPDEVWLNQAESGERYFTFISRFEHGSQKFTYVSVCLTIDGIPSFVFLAFPTCDEDLVDQYRRGQDLKVRDPIADPSILPSTYEIEKRLDEQRTKQMAKEDLEKLAQEQRHPQDIPKDSFEKFETYVDPTLDDPDEIWTFTDADNISWYTFISRHHLDPSHDKPNSRTSSGEQFTMIVVCRNTAQTGLKELQVVFAFPTLDPAFVQQFRRGINSMNKSFGIGWTQRQAA